MSRQIIYRYIPISVQAGLTQPSSANPFHVLANRWTCLVHHSLLFEQARDEFLAFTSPSLLDGGLLAKRRKAFVLGLDRVPGVGTGKLQGSISC